MGVLYRALLRPLLFLLPAEWSHALASAVLRVLHRSRVLRRLVRPRVDPALRVEAMGLTFATPVCVAAGFDKSGTMFNGLGALGFGCVEVGTVTAHAQPGNPRPRMFRLVRDRAVVNRMGFNNPGAVAVSHALAHDAPDPGLLLGVNVGKSKVTPLESAADDYAASVRALAPYAQYVVVNVSSPNTPGLRTLQSVDTLRPVLAAVTREIRAFGRQVPLLVKIAPDLADDEIDAIVDLAVELGLAGIVATNTTVAREGLASDRARVDICGAGGLSGAPLRARALEVIRRCFARARGRLAIVGVGGIATSDDAWDALCAGASVVQAYTAMIYRGPGLAREIARGLRARMRKEGIARIGDVTGRGFEAGAPKAESLVERVGTGTP